ncbi:hypothetical protein [Flavobacterium sp.]|jgi:hypothetical protein|uniref:hypothetical protein n=1 Tax=Flavobacterium sp. TaxID=239 RepID=UPI0037C11183
MLNTQRYTTEELESRLKFFAGLVLVSVFGGAMFTIIYSLVWVQQPMSGIAPADKQFFKILETMITFLAGSITTLVTLKATTSNPSQPVSNEQTQIVKSTEEQKVE